MQSFGSGTTPMTLTVGQHSSWSEQNFASKRFSCIVKLESHHSCFDNNEREQESCWQMSGCIPTAFKDSSVCTTASAP